MTESEPPHDPYVALRGAGFRWYILSLLTMTIATEVQGIVVAWQVYSHTHDPLSLGLIGLAEALPFIGMALFAGHVADRMDRRWLALGALLALLACSVSLLAITLHPWITAGARVWPIYLVIVASGFARSFLRPASSALSAELVHRSHYANAATWRSSTWQLAAVLGPAVGGMLYGFTGPAMAYVADAALMVVAIVTMASVRRTPAPIAPAEGSVAASLATGIRFVWREPVLLGALTLDLFSVLFGGAVALLPVFASEILHAGPQGLGVLRAAPAVGAVLMSLYLSHRPPIERTGRVLLGAVTAFGLCMIGFALSRDFWLSLGLLAAGGMADNVSVVIRSTLLQLLTPPGMLGRVSAVNSIFIGSSNEIGAFESGVAARLLGTVNSVVFGGIMTLSVVAIMAWRVPRLRQLGKLQAAR